MWGVSLLNLLAGVLVLLFVVSQLGLFLRERKKVVLCSGRAEYVTRLKETYDYPLSFLVSSFSAYST